MAYQGLLYTHSILRYVVLLLLLVVLIRSLAGWTGRKPYLKADNLGSLLLLIVTHTQFLLGILLAFVSPYVHFDGTTMKDAAVRYWSVEHIFMMLLAVVLITVARVTHKKLSDHTAKHKRLFILNAAALLIIVTAIVLSHRGLMSSSLFN